MKSHPIHMNIVREVSDGICLHMTWPRPEVCKTPCSLSEMAAAFSLLYNKGINQFWSQKLQPLSPASDHSAVWIEQIA